MEAPGTEREREREGESHDVTCWTSADAERFGPIMQRRAASRPEHQPLEESTLSSHCVADSTGGEGGWWGMGGRESTESQDDTRRSRGSAESLVEGPDGSDGLFSLGLKVQ